MRNLIGRLRQGDGGSALITALLATTIMLGLGLALLSLVDIQASHSSTERTRDRGFNLAESVLTSEAFVLGRSWPGTVPSPNGICGTPAMAFGETLGTTAATADTRIALLRNNLNASFTDSGFGGATWSVNVCDDDAASSVWNDTLMSTKHSYDENLNNKVWVRAQATIGDVTRSVAGLVQVRSKAALSSKYGVATGTLTDDLGTSVNNLSTNALNGVLSSLLGTTPTVAPDPTQTATTPPSSGVTGVRCGALDLKAVPTSTCLSGTIGALGALPIITTTLTGGKLEQFPTTTAATSEAINQMRTQALAPPSTYTKLGAGGTYAAAPPCTITGSPSSTKLAFIEKVGTGDQYCYVSVGTGVQYKALVIGSGRVIIRGNGTTTAAPVFTGAAAGGPQVNTFSGVVYGLNLQRHAVADGGLGLGDSASPGREIVRIESGAHVKGSVSADGKSGRVTIVPPPVTLNTSALVDALVPCTVVLGLTVCTLRDTIKALGSVTTIVDDLVARVGLAATTTAIVNQLGPQRASYGSAITSDVAAVNALTVYGASGVIPKTFRELTAN